jgi:phytanoyl-CoA hydroxylase
MPVKTRRVKPSKSTSTISEQYATQGYVLLRNAIERDVIDGFLADFLKLTKSITAQQFTSAHDPELAKFFDANPLLETAVYDKVRDQPWAAAFAQQEALADPAREILGTDIGVFRKAPFRIDMPMWTKELALWHQDHYYVRGNTDIITAWVPFQDVNYVNGCLSIMPGSHLLGPVPHDLQIAKKFLPSSIFGNEIRMVEMNKGDVLLFSSLLLHNGNMNYSQSIRYSMQPRFTPMDKPVDPAMGGVIPL